VSTAVKSFDEARAQGAIALFGEKYGDQVRVVSVEDCTTELCGGTHVSSTGEIGVFFIVSESSVGSGLRRIEAVTGRGAEAYVQQRLADLHKIAASVNARPGEESERVQALLEQSREQRRAIQDLEGQLASQSVGSLVDQAEEIAGIQVLAAQVEAGSVDALRDMCDQFRAKLGTCLVALGAVINDRPMIVIALTKDLIPRGLHAGKIAGAAAKAMGGGGGGRPDMAQAGGRDAGSLGRALGDVPGIVRTNLK